MAPTLVNNGVSTKTETETRTNGTIIKTTVTTTTETYSDGSTVIKTKRQVQKTPAGYKSSSVNKPINGNKYEFGYHPSRSTALKVSVTTPNEFIKKALQEHNRLRAIHHSPPLKVIRELCKIAQGWANKIAKEGKRYHSTYEFGENIFWCTADKPGDYVTKRWYDEIEDWDWKTLAGNGKGDVGHFTQVIWKKTKEMGIAAAYSSEGHLCVVAEYSPPGNFKNRYADNVLPE